MMAKEEVGYVFSSSRFYLGSSSLYNTFYLIRIITGVVKIFYFLLLLVIPPP